MRSKAMHTPLKSAVGRELQRPDIRAEFERSRRALRAALGEWTADAATVRLVELGAGLDAGVARVKRELLATSLCMNDEHHALGEWICGENEKLAEIAFKLLDGSCGTVTEPALVLNASAAALFHWGEAMKWSTCRERHNYQPLHGVISEAMRAERHRHPLRLVCDGRGRTVTLEALYFRALMLDRFGGGSLTRQQMEVLDAWLWEWSPALSGTPQYPGGKVFRVDLDGSAGLREGKRAGEGESLYLQLEPLEAHRRQVIEELHRGRIVPAHGCAADMRVEEHVAVIDQLQRAFESCGEDAARRAERLSGAGTRLEVWLGLAEILSRGVSPPTVETTGAWKVTEDVRAAIASGNKNHPALGIVDDPSKRYLWLVDVSESGYGFEALGRDAVGIEVGDLIGWRKAKGEPCTIGKVVRRVPGASPGQVFLGVQRLTDAAQPLRLVEEVGERELSENTFVFVAGIDESGRHDAFLLPENLQRDNAAFRARAGNDLYKLRFNRVRNKGRGWVLAGFEIVMAEAPQAPLSFGSTQPQDLPSLEFTLEDLSPSAPPPVPRFELTLAEDDEYDRAFTREVGSRLLN
jgi:hypothetical protein